MSNRSYVPDLCDVVHLHPARVAELRAALIGEAEVGELAETFRTLGDPTRVRILDALSHGELCVCDLAALVRMSESAVSHQLRLLRNLRLVKPRRDGRMVFYALDDRHIITLFRQGLRHVQETERTGRAKPLRKRGVAGDTGEAR
jgi:ArsR family transcriptional regulator